MFNENFSTLRKDRGFSQEQMAVRLNVVRQTISKWEKGLSVPDAEMLIEIAEVLNISVSDLLGEKVEIKEDNSLEAIAVELAKLNELLVLKHQKSEQMKKKIVQIAIVAIVIFFVCSIYEDWNEIFYEFGQNLYHMLND